MFGQSDQNQQQNDYNNIFDDPVGTSDAAAVPSAAPGAPVGPLTDDHALPPSPVAEPATTPIIADSVVADPVPLVTDGAGDELLGIKQDALQELSPLVGHLDQTPEEKFRTTMMMIQASDDHSLIKTAYEAAKQITDEKARAQALLDVVNEINYFTQQHSA